MNYCVIGTESFLIHEKIDEITVQWLKSAEEINRNIYDAAAGDFSISQMLEDCWTVPFLSEYKLVVVRNAVFLSTQGSLSELDQGRLSDYLKNSCPSTILIFTGDFEKLDSRKKIVKTLQQHAQVFVFHPLDEAQFKSYVRDCCKKHRLELNDAAMNELLRRLRPDLTNFQNVLSKLLLYPGVLDQTAIDALVSRPLEENVFDLVDAVVRHDLKQAMHLWRDLQILNTDPIGLVALIGGQFRLLYQTKILLRKGMSDKAMASQLKVHPYRIKLARESCQKINSDQLAALIQHCAMLDQQFKTGTLDRTIGFETFLIAATRG